jgi:acetyl-CoA acetyltransferase family protein
MHPGAHPPENTAVVMAASGQTVTYGELDAAANRVSHLLRSHGLKPGDHIALIVDNTPAFFELLWGAHYAGLLYTAISTRLTPEEAAYIVQDCEAGALVVAAPYAETAKGLDGLIPESVARYSVGGSIDGWTAIEDAVADLPTTVLPEERIGGKDMLYSSGTTGRPKGIKPKDLTVPIDEAPIIVVPILRDMLGVGADSVYLSPAPQYHAAPLRFTMAIHQLGGSVVMMERFTPEGALDAIERYGVTITQMVPTMFVRLLRLPEATRAAADLSTLKTVIHAAAPCPVDVKQQIIDWVGPIVHEYYASTEACGLTNPYDKQPMGVFGERCVEKYGFTREEQDAFAAESVRRAQAAVADGTFKDEIAPVTVAGRKGDVVVDTDEQPGKCDIGKIPTLKPAFKKDGTITAASSSSINDGAAALVLMSEEAAKARGAVPLARIVAHATNSQAPEWFTTAPVGAIAKVLEKAGWKAADVGLFEVNEAFATVGMAPMRELGIPHDKLNVHGGACALGHPIGASGARLLVTLVNALKRRGGKRGVAALCIGGGEATAMAIELA